MTWLVLANTNTCRIYEYDKKEKSLNLIHELIHEASKLKGIDLETDRPGHYKTDGSARGSYVPNETPQEIEIEYFARNVVETLDKGRKTNQFQNLITVMPPHMNGLIHKNIHESLKKCIEHNIVKDYMHLKNNEIINTLKKDIPNKFS